MCSLSCSHGSPNITKSLIENFMLRKLSTNYSNLTRTLQVSSKDSTKSKTQDCYLVTKTGRIFEVFEEIEFKKWRCWPVVVRNWDQDDLPWALVGVWLYDHVDKTQPCVIDEANVSGKAIHAGRFLTEFRNCWYSSKIDE